MYCKNCGNPLGPAAKFCKACGEPVTATAQPQRNGKPRSRRQSQEQGRRKGYRSVIAAVMVLAILALAFFTVIKPKFLNEPKTTFKTGGNSDQAALLKPRQTGNTFGNLANGGNLVESNGWIYYSNGQGIYKTKDMAEEGTQLCKATVPGNLNAVGDWIYYTAAMGNEHYNVIYRVKYNGSKSERISEEPCSALTASGSKLYYQVIEPGTESNLGTLYSMNMDGSQPQKVIDDKCLFQGMDGGFIYYTLSEGRNNALYRIQPDGTGKKKLIDEYAACTVAVVEDGWFYYGRETGKASWKLDRIKVDGGSAETITKIAASPSSWKSALNVKGDWIYFVDPGNGEEGKEAVYKVKADGTGREKVSDSGWSCELFTMKEDMYCSYSENSADELENWNISWDLLK